MFKCRAINGSRNTCGRNIARFREELGISQRQFADQMQIRGLDIDKNAVQRMEDGSRFVPDIELKAIAAFFGVSMDVLSIE